MVAAQFKNVTRVFAGKGKQSSLTAIDNVNFSVEKSEFLAVVGPSGCGKSTILNLCAGLDFPSSGEVFIAGERVTKPNPQVGFMLQKDLLLPWRTIAKNVAFGLEARAISREEKESRVRQELERCQIAQFSGHYPYQLSGGMRQRAALARTLAIKPSIMLLDEPFSALDAQTKLLLQNSFSKTIMSTGMTTILITHDLSEAVAMADRILVMSERPGTFVDEIILDLPSRDEPMARRSNPKSNEYIAYLFNALKLHERAN